MQGNNSIQEVFRLILADPRYRTNIDWGEARAGHPEGSIRAHIAELESRLEAVRSHFPDAYYWKLQILVHTHDAFKGQAKPGVAISDPESHASLARDFLAKYCNDIDLLNMVQYHDEGYALWQQFAARGKYSQKRFRHLLGLITDWDLFLWFVIIDGSSLGKNREALSWFVKEVNKYTKTSVTPDVACDLSARFLESGY